MEPTGPSSRGSRSSVSARLLGLLTPASSVDERLLTARVRTYLGAIGAFGIGFAIHDYVRSVWLFGASPIPSPMVGLLGVLGVSSAALWAWLRGKDLTVAQLEPIELAASVGLLAGLGGMHLLAGPQDRTIGLVPGLALILVCRASIVPTRASHTFVLGILATGFHAWAAARSGPRHGYSALGWAWIVIIWGTAFSFASALVACTIYRLRGAVQEARQLGDYTLEECIGEGSMGVVYRARHQFLKRPAALKLIHPDRAGERAILRFEREAQETAQLAHPNAVAVFDYGRTPDGVFYYVMEYLQGLDLQSLVELDGPQPPGRVVHILAQAAGALEAAHRRGLVHRDVKPANVMLSSLETTPDLVKVVDFGLVKAVSGTRDLSLSRSDVVVGTPLYMSPEAIADPSRITHRADLYALGCTGWFLLAGRSPFEGRRMVEVCAAHLHEDPGALSDVRGERVPADLERLILDCLKKDPEGRPVSARVLRRALLGCGCAGDWDEERARSWWAGHRDPLYVRRAHEPTAPRRAVGAGPVG